MNIATRALQHSVFKLSARHCMYIHKRVEKDMYNLWEFQVYIVFWPRVLVFGIFLLSRHLRKVVYVRWFQRRKISLRDISKNGWSGITKLGKKSLALSKNLFHVMRCRMVIIQSFYQSFSTLYSTATDERDEKINEVRIYSTGFRNNWKLYVK